MNSFSLEVDPKDRQYGRFSSAVLRMLIDAVAWRVENGTRKSDIAKRIGCDRSQLSRVLNGNVRNLTIKTVSDILWATDCEPEIYAEPKEDIVSISPSLTIESNNELRITASNEFVTINTIKLNIFQDDYLAVDAINPSSSAFIAQQKSAHLLSIDLEGLSR